MAEPQPTIKDRVINAVARGALFFALALPYNVRVRTFGWVFAHIVGPVAGWRKRVESNLKLAMPELSYSQRAALSKKVPENVGRALIETYSGEEFIDRVKDTARVGPGLAALEAAHADGRPAVLITAHLGNYDVARGTLKRQGYPIGGLYKPMTNPAFNEHYERAISSISEPVFPTTKRGILGLIRHLKAGGMMGIVGDVGSTNAPVLEFFGQRAHTPLSAAEWALKENALLIPVFGIRKPDGLSFEIRVEEPIPHTTPVDMMQRYNDIVERIVREDPGQWFWIHNRWKLSRHAERMIAKA